MQFLGETKLLFKPQLLECAISVVVFMEVSAGQVLIPSMGVNEMEKDELAAYQLKICASSMIQDIGQDGRVVKGSRIQFESLQEETTL